MSADACRELLQRWRELAFSWRIEDVAELVAGLGWREVDRAPGGSVRAATGLPVNDARAEVWTGEGVVDRVSVQASDRVTRSDPDGAATLQDAFVAAVAAASAVFGEPTDRRPGAGAEVRWRRAGETVRVIRGAASVVIEISRNAYRDEIDADAGL